MEPMDEAEAKNEAEGKDFDEELQKRPSGFVPPSIEELQELIPEYDFVEFIDRGGMGAVYKAIQPQLERMVAVKLLPPDFGKDYGFDKRFRREAKTMARLAHPNIVAVHDFGETSKGHLYIVMEFIHGSDLGRLIKSKALEPSRILPIIYEVCAALQYAHDHGIIHRDIKPGNILIDEEGHVKVADFGLAKALKEDIEMTQISSPGVSIGTPAYMAPETVEENEIDHRADIYSLGVVIYEMLTGTLPTGAWDPPSKCSGADQKFDEVVNRALQSNRDARFQQASEISQIFSSAKLRKGKFGSPSRDSPFTPLRVTFGSGLLVLILVGAIAWKTGTLHLIGVGNPPPLTAAEFESRSRDLAEWVIKRGGFIQIRVPESNISRVSDLPPGVFEIWRISFERQTSFSDEDLKGLVDQCEYLPKVSNFNLRSTAITPNGLKEFSRIRKNVTGLNIAFTQAVSDDSIPLLGSLKHLQMLILDPPDKSAYAPLTEKGKETISATLPNTELRFSIDW